MTYIKVITGIIWGDGTVFNSSLCLGVFSHFSKINYAFMRKNAFLKTAVGKQEHFYLVLISFQN